MRNCIDDGVNELAANFGLVVDNVAVPEVFISPDVQAGLDAIVRSRLETEKAAQDKLKADAEASAEQARQEGEIRIAQSRMQEESRQQRILAELERKISAAGSANANGSARQAIIRREEQLIASCRARLVIEQARSRRGPEKPRLLERFRRTYAEPAISSFRWSGQCRRRTQATDHIHARGTVPTLVLPGPGIVPTVETGGAQPSDVTP